MISVINTTVIESSSCTPQSIGDNNFLSSDGDAIYVDSDGEEEAIEIMWIKMRNLLPSF